MTDTDKQVRDRGVVLSLKGLNRFKSSILRQAGNGDQIRINKLKKIVDTAYAEAVQEMTEK